MTVPGRPGGTLKFQLAFLKNIDAETIQKYRMFAGILAGIGLIVIFFLVTGKKEAKYTRVENEKKAELRYPLRISKGISMMKAEF